MQIAIQICTPLTEYVSGVVLISVTATYVLLDNLLM